MQNSYLHSCNSQPEMQNKISQQRVCQLILQASIHFLKKPVIGGGPKFLFSVRGAVGSIPITD